MQSHQTLAHRRQAGQNLVELGLLLPMLILMLGILFDMGRAFNAYIVMTNAAREAARVGAVTPSDTAGITTAALGEMQRGGLSTSLTQVQISTDYGTREVRVTLTYSFPLLGSMIFSGQPVLLQRGVSMVIL